MMLKGQYTATMQQIPVSGMEGVLHCEEVRGKEILQTFSSLESVVKLTRYN